MALLSRIKLVLPPKVQVAKVNMLLSSVIKVSGSMMKSMYVFMLVF